LTGKKRRLDLQAETEKECQEWIEELQQLVQRIQLLPIESNKRQSIFNELWDQSSGGPPISIEQRMTKYICKKLKNYDMSASEIQDNAAVFASATELEKVYFQLSEETQQFGSICIKLILTCLSFKNNEFLDLVQNVINKATGIGKYGLVHTAIQVENTVIEWNDSSLVLVSDTESYGQTHTMLALDLIEGNEFDITERKYIQDICKLIANWNGTKTYSKVKCNCQHFTSAVLKVLGISDPLSDKSSSKIANFISEISNVDKSNLGYSFILPGDTIPTVFDEHKKLDEACFLKSNLLQRGTEDYRILKAIDRVFWLRSYGLIDSQSELFPGQEEKKKFLDNLLEKCQPANIHGTPCCFFDDPHETVTQYRPNFKQSKRITALSTTVGKSRNL